jgi:hypothetical protein
MTRRKKGPATPPKFAGGEHVHVKPGVADPDYPDLPLGGWAGEIIQIERESPPLYLIRWNQHTLDSIHPVYRKRAERDAFDFHELWLSKEDLLPDTGEPVAIEQPTHIETRPLATDDQDDRVRVALGVTSDDPVPDVDEATSLTYYEYLEARLSFPFEAEFSADTGPMEQKSYPVTVLGLLDPEEYDDDFGLVCEARQGKQALHLPLSEVEVPKGKPNHKLVGDYSYWFWNWR